MITRFRISPSWIFVMPAVLLGMTLEHRSGAAETPCPVGAPAETHYAPNEDLERIDVALLGGAEKQIDMAAYVLTDRSVNEALREAAGRGVNVRIWRDANMAERVGDVDVEAQLGDRVQGLEIRSNSPGGELMHLKGYCVDHRLLRTGSTNFSRSGETRQERSGGAARRVYLRRV
jgi:phosphatidylserine/phosphatidylglycerophosphate/cardiolipin synthase-like enzyme